MKILTRHSHGIADYALVVVFLSLPMALGLSGPPRTLSYSYAFYHLLITALSVFPPGGLPFLPYRFHVMFESIGGAFLILSPWLFHFADVPAARGSFMLLGAVLLVIAVFTDFDRRRETVPRPPGDRRRWYNRSGG